MNLALITHKVVKGEGQARVNYEIARRAMQAGWRVTIVAGQVAPELQACPELTWVNIPWSDRFTELAGVWDFARKSGSWLRTEGARFDITHVNGFVAQGRSDVNAVHFVHAAWKQSPWHPCRAHMQEGADKTGGLRRLTDVHGAYQGLFSALNARWEQQAFRQARQIVAVSNRVRQELLDSGVAPAKIQVIGNGVDLEEFHPGSADRRALGLPADVPLGLFVGNLRLMRKNLDTALRAMTRLPRLHLAVAGTVEGSPYPSLAAHLNVSERVHFLGFRADMPDIMRACDFLAFPSRYEPFGLALLEALASGLPVLTAKSVGGAEIVTPACGRVLADAEDWEGLAAVAKIWMEQPEQMPKMRLAASAVAQEHSWLAMADAYLRLYAHLTGEKAQEHPDRENADAAEPFAQSAGRPFACSVSVKADRP